MKCGAKAAQPKRDLNLGQELQYPIGAKGSTRLDASIIWFNLTSQNLTKPWLYFV